MGILIVSTGPTFSRGPDELSAQCELDEDDELQQLFLYLWRCGPEITGLAVATMLDDANLSPRVLDGLRRWTTHDPDKNFRLFGYRKPRPARPFLRIVKEPGAET